MAEATNEPGSGTRFLRFLALSLGVGLLAVLAGALAGGELKTPILFGAGAATFAALVAFPCLHLGLKHGTSGLLAGFTAGFFVRTILVAAALIGSGLRGGTALVFAFAFFLVYAGTMAVEIAYVFAVSRGRPPGAVAQGS